MKNYYLCPTLKRILAMKKIKSNYLLIAIISLTLWSSCSTDVDLYTDGKETTIVYGYLDVDQDTNYVKITKSFIGDATQLAPDYNASNYDYKLNVKLIGKFANSSSVTTDYLDTTSVYKPYDPTGIFYSGRDQVLYYTTKKLKENENYKLVIERNDSVVVSSNVRTISGSKIRKPMVTINFDSDYSNQVTWSPNVIGDLAAYYEVVGYFHYKQLDPGSTDTSYYSMKWVMGTGTGEELYNSADRLLSISYTPSAFFSRLAADPNIANNTSTYTRRFVDCFEIVITSTGDELYNYILIQNSGSAIQDTPEYTNIDNGLGIFSSRSVCSKKISVNEMTINRLIDYDWGFEKTY